MGHEDADGLWSVPVTPGDIVTYKLTVKYDGINGDTVVLRDPVPKGMKPILDSIATGGKGHFSFEQKPVIQMQNNQYVLTAKIADLVSDSVVEITYSAQVETVTPDAEGYQYWDNTVYTQKLGQTTSDTIRLWYKQDEIIPPQPTDHLLNYVFTGDIPKDMAVPEAQRHHENDSVTLPTIKAPANYTFSGWKTADGKAVGPTFRMPDQDVTLYGSWEHEKPTTVEICYQYEGDVPANAPAIDSSWNQVLDAVGSVNLLDNLDSLPDAVFLGWTPHLQIIENNADVHDVELAKDYWSEAYTGWFQDFSFSIKSPLDLAQFDLSRLCVDGKTFSSKLTMVGKLDTAKSPTIKKKVTLGNAPVTEAKPGDILTYTITVTNPDDTAIQTNLRLRDIHDGSGELTVGQNLPAGVSYDADQQEFTIAKLNPGQRIKIPYTYKVPTSDSGKVIKNTAKLLNIPDAQESSTTVRVLTADFTLTKTLLPNPFVSAGTKLTYTITIQNTGELPLAELSVQDSLLRFGSKDTLAGNVEFVADKSTEGVSFHEDKQEFTVDHPVAVGDTITIVCQYPIVDADSLRTIQNSAVASGRAENGDSIVRIASADEISIPDLKPEPPTPPTPPTPEPDRPDPPEDLNTEDHYSYIIGYKDGTIRPYGTITRGEVATIFFRLLTDRARDKYWCQTNDYTDVPADLWCNNAISTLSNMGIIDGFQDGSFKPYGTITRAQFSKMAVGFFETTAKEYEGYFTDVAPDAWYTSYVEATARVGLISGFEDGTFRPNDLITRAQACVIVNRALDRHPDEDHLLPERKMITWPDNNPRDWFYADLQEATNSHDYRMETKHIHGEKVKQERWTGKLSQRDWAALEHQWSDSHSATGGGAVTG